MIRDILMGLLGERIAKLEFNRFFLRDGRKPLRGYSDGLLRLFGGLGLFGELRLNGLKQRRSLSRSLSRTASPGLIHRTNGRKVMSFIAPPGGARST